MECIKLNKAIIKDIKDTIKVLNKKYFNKEHIKDYNSDIIYSMTCKDKTEFKTVLAYARIFGIFGENKKEDKKLKKSRIKNIINVSQGISKILIKKNINKNEYIIQFYITKKRSVENKN